jgi:hypothetical protein
LPLAWWEFPHHAASMLSSHFSTNSKTRVSVLC